MLMNLKSGMFPEIICGLLRIHVEVCLKPSLMRTYSAPALGLETAANDCKIQMHPQISTGSQLCAKGASISTRHGKIYCSSSWRVYCESLQPRNCIGQRCLWTRYHESRTWIMADLIPSKRSCWPGIFKFKTTKMKERFNISQSPICLAWNWSLFRWISPTKHLHWSGPVSPSRSMVDAQDATETSSVTPCQQKLNFRVCSQWPKSSQKPDRSVLVFSLCAHSVSQTCDLAYRNHYFRRWSSIRTHAHSHIHMFIDCTFYICIFLCTHTFESQNDVDGKADFNSNSLKQS